MPNVRPSDIDEFNEFSTSVQPVLDMLCTRRHIQTRAVVREVGVPMTTFRTVSELLQFLCDIIDGTCIITRFFPTSQTDSPPSSTRIYDETPYLASRHQPRQYPYQAERGHRSRASHRLGPRFGHAEVSRTTRTIEPTFYHGECSFPQTESSTKCALGNLAVHVRYLAEGAQYAGPSARYSG